MNHENDLEQSIKNLRVNTSSATDQHILADASATLAQSAPKSRPAGHTKLWIRRTIMKNTWTKLATTAALIIAAVLLCVAVFEKSPTPAYALEQTLEANRDLRFIHLKFEPAGKGVEDIWAQFDDNGELLHLRMNFPNTMDGPKDVVWQEGKAEVWFKKKGGIIVLREKNVLARLKMSYIGFDPKLIAEQLYHAQADKKAQMEIQESPFKDEPIVITSTSEGFRKVFKVDPETKLLQQLEKYELKDGEYKFLGLIKYLDYNQPVDPEIFVLNPPADVVRVDQTSQEVGLVQGDLSDEEVAVEVARQFFEALIAEDYAKAGKILQGFPAEEMEKLFGHINFLRIISIGKPTPHPDPRTRFLCVPCEVEQEVNGKKVIKKFTLNIRAVYGQPDRWAVGGGI